MREGLRTKSARHPRLLRIRLGENMIEYPPAKRGNSAAETFDPTFRDGVMKKTVTMLDLAAWCGPGTVRGCGWRHDRRWDPHCTPQPDRARQLHVARFEVRPWPLVIERGTAD